MAGEELARVGQGVGEENVKLTHYDWPSTTTLGHYQVLEIAVKVWQKLICGNHSVGEFLIEGSDNYHWYGRFRAGPDFAIYEELLKRVFHLQQDPKSGFEGTEDWLDVLEEVNAFPLQLVNQQTGKLSPITDFQIEGFFESDDFQGVYTREGASACFHDRR